ncbi:MAG: hypothetical protein R2706_11060 [Acidimicrobiales bacterium]
MPAEHAGKTLDIKLFDAGEGMNYLQVLSPTNVPQNFTWYSAACRDTGFCTSPDDLTGGTGMSGSCAGKPCLSVTGNKFQNNEATLRITLPANYTCTTNCWWKVRYVPLSGIDPATGQAYTVHDATEWSVAVTGDPVRLTD